MGCFIDGIRKGKLTERNVDIIQVRPIGSGGGDCEGSYGRAGMG